MDLGWLGGSAKRCGLGGFWRGLDGRGFGGFCSVAAAGLGDAGEFGGIWGCVELFRMGSFGGFLIWFERVWVLIWIGVSGLYVAF